MTSKKTLVALQFDYETKSLEENFKTLSSLIHKSPVHSIILAPELCLSGYSYEHMEESAEFSKKILPHLQELSHDRTIALTLIEKIDDKFYNNLKIISNGKIIQSRAKAKLFHLGDEEKYFTSGDTKEITIIEIDGIKIAALICFELRFTELWQSILGADIILVPSYWGKLRHEHFETLTKALAIANQTFVITANSADKTMASGSGIITPFGNEYRDDTASLIEKEVNLSEIQKMRRYLNIGLV
jgi:predicted amidohydrolase